MQLWDLSFLYIFIRVYKCKNSKRQCSVFPLRWRSSEILADSRKRMLMKRYCHSVACMKLETCTDGWLKCGVFFFFILPALFGNSLGRDGLSIFSRVMSRPTNYLTKSPTSVLAPFSVSTTYPPTCRRPKRRKRFQFYCSLTSLTHGR